MSANQQVRRAFRVQSLLEASAASDQRERVLASARKRGQGAAPSRAVKKLSVASKLAPFLEKFFQGNYNEIFIRNKKEGKTFFEKKVFPSNSPFQKTLARGRKKYSNNNQADQREAIIGNRAAARTARAASHLPFPKNFSKGRELQ